MRRRQEQRVDRCGCSDRSLRYLDWRSWRSLCNSCRKSTKSSDLLSELLLRYLVDLALLAGSARLAPRAEGSLSNSHSSHCIIWLVACCVCCGSFVGFAMPRKWEIQPVGRGDCQVSRAKQVSSRSRTAFQECCAQAPIMPSPAKGLQIASRLLMDR